MRTRRQSKSFQNRPLTVPTPRRYSHLGATKTSGDLNHKLTIKNVQLTPRSIGDRWNRLESALARPHPLSLPSASRSGRTIVFSPQRGAGLRKGRKGGGRPVGEKGENSREVGSNREGLIPLDCVPCPATPALHPSPPCEAASSALATFPPLLQPKVRRGGGGDDDDGCVNVRDRRGLSFSPRREKSRARRHRMHIHAPFVDERPLEGRGLG